ncbi:MAG: phosphotransferase [Chloroflexota bacterium]
MLDHRDIAGYLVQRGLISRRQIVQGDLRVTDASARNSDFTVVSRSGPSYMVKQATDIGTIATLEHEAAIYKLLQADELADINCYLPHFFDYDPGEHILVLELLADAETLWARHRRLGRFSASLAAATGHALGLLHRSNAADILSGSMVDGAKAIASRPTSILSVHHPELRFFEEISGANTHLIKIIQQAWRFGELLDELRMEWRQECFMHGDVKWDNLLAVPLDGHRRGAPGLKIIDWELACVGDPCWDAGSIFGDYLSFWLLSIPITGAEPPDHYLQLARYPLEKMQPAIRAFWSAYIRASSMPGHERDMRLLRAVKYAGARLLQTAYERSQASSRLTSDALCLLQLGANILQRPAEASLYLLGIPVGQGSTL